MKSVVGHRNPDTDSVAASILLSNILGAEFGPVIANNLNKETKFVLEFLNIEVPPLVSSGAKVYVLVDHNEPGQIPPEVDISKVTMIVDHHKLGGLSLPSPIDIKIEPVGSTCTIIKEYFDEQGLPISKKQASLIMAGIISDTLNLKSPTTTPKDAQTLKELEQISEFKAEDLARKMFEAKSDLTGVAVEEIIMQDYKKFEFGCQQVGFGVFETVNPKGALERLEEIYSALTNKKEEDEVNYMFFAIVDIMSQVSYLMLLSKTEKDLAIKAYGGKVEDDYMTLPGFVSRKKQMIPPLENILKNE
jgi:manganese-dependent inorganic pyrophosphatase